MFVICLLSTAEIWVNQVAWHGFSKTGIICCRKVLFRRNLMLMALESGADDIHVLDEEYEVIASPDYFNQLQNGFRTE